jgi:hypothetical protein
MPAPKTDLRRCKPMANGERSTKISIDGEEGWKTQKIEHLKKGSETPLTLRGLGRLRATFLYPSSLQSRGSRRLAFRRQYPKAGL